jgi:hypothetical protein
MEMIFSGCGTLCNDCEYFTGAKNPKCTGCKEKAGKPFWGTCGTYACMQEHDITHCGICEEFPCDKFMNQYDPSHGPISAVIRAGILAYRAKHGDEKAAVLTKKIQQE